MIINDYGEIEFEDINEAFRVIKNVIDTEYALGNHVFKDQKSLVAWDALEKHFGCMPKDFDPLDFSEEIVKEIF